MKRDSVPAGEPVVPWCTESEVVEIVNESVEVYSVNLHCKLLIVPCFASKERGEGKVQKEEAFAVA